MQIAIQGTFYDTRDHSLVRASKEGVVVTVFREEGGMPVGTFDEPSWRRLQQQNVFWWIDPSDTPEEAATKIIERGERLGL